MTFSHTTEGQETTQNFSREAHHQGESWEFCIIWCMERSFYCGKIVSSISCYHFSLSLGEGLRLFWNFVPLHANLHLQIAERKFLLLGDRLVWWNFLGREGCKGQGKATALSVPLISLLQSNCMLLRVSSAPPQLHWEMCLTHLSPTSQLPSSLPDKPQRENICLSRLLLLHLSLRQEMLQRRFWCGIPWTGLAHCPAEPGSWAGVPRSPYQEWIRVFHSCKWYFLK